MNELLLGLLLLPLTDHLITSAGQSSRLHDALRSVRQTDNLLLLVRNLGRIDEADSVGRCCQADDRLLSVPARINDSDNGRWRLGRSGQTDNGRLDGNLGRITHSAENWRCIFVVSLAAGQTDDIWFDNVAGPERSIEKVIGESIAVVVNAGIFIVLEFLVH